MSYFSLNIYCMTLPDAQTSLSLSKSKFSDKITICQHRSVFFSNQKLILMMIPGNMCFT